MRDCLERQLNRLADRNSCVAPWTSTASLRIDFNPVRVRMPHRTMLSFSIANPLGAADLLLHGQSGAHGWGQLNAPDQYLLVVRGFDPLTRRYIYHVNQRFGNTSQAVNAARNPVTLTALLRVDVGPDARAPGPDAPAGPRSHVAGAKGVDRRTERGVQLGRASQSHGGHSALVGYASSHGTAGG